MLGRRSHIIWPFLLPSLIIYGVFFVYPALHAFRVSLHSWSGFTADMTFVGLQNFQELWYDDIFRTALQNNVYLVFVGGVFVLLLSIFFAVSIVNYRGVMGNVLTSVVYFPHLISAVGVAILWIFIYNSRWGMLNNLLKLVGLGHLSRPWLGASSTVMRAVLVPIVWQSVGFYMLILKAGIERIPGSLYEAAHLDGANNWQAFVNITFPLVQDIILICGVLWTIAAFKHFGLIQALTAGGPGNASQVISTYLFRMAFEGPGGTTPIFRMGYATAMAVVLFILVLGFAIVQMRMGSRESIQY